MQTVSAGVIQRLKRIIAIHVKTRGHTALGNLDRSRKVQLMLRTCQRLNTLRGSVNRCHLNQACEYRVPDVFYRTPVIHVRADAQAGKL